MEEQLHAKDAAVERLAAELRQRDGLIESQRALLGETGAAGGAEGDFVLDPRSLTEVRRAPGAADQGMPSEAEPPAERAWQVWDDAGRRPLRGAAAPLAKRRARRSAPEVSRREPDRRVGPTRAQPVGDEVGEGRPEPGPWSASAEVSGSRPEQPRVRPGGPPPGWHDGQQGDVAVRAGAGPYATRRPQPRRAQSGSGAERCVDSPVGWHDWGGVDCHVYAQADFCTADGEYGNGWWYEEWGTFEDYEEDGHTAWTACCACGGGRVCQDSPANWVDKKGHSCATYAARGWCSSDGSPGPIWPSAWGSFADQAKDGHSAATACCACRPPAVDSGGRGCDYYALHPTHCGCCDDEDFVAHIACANICVAGGPTGGGTLSEITDGWPSDAQLIIFASGHSMGRLSAENWHVRFPRLRVVHLLGVSLKGTLPDELGLLPELRYLNVAANSLQGTLPPQLGRLAKLQALIFKYNYFWSPLPSELGDLAELRNLRAASNILTGTLPVELGKLGRLVELGLSTNDLSGTLPSELGDLASLQTVDLSDNHFTGSLPSELGNLGDLTYLTLSRNRLDGTLPSELGSLTSLIYLEALRNNFTGALPAELGTLSDLNLLSLGDNQLDGTLPSWLGDLSALETLELYNNNLVGTLPAEMGNMTGLQWLQLQGNFLTGPLPSEWGQLGKLQWLNLGSNSLSGAVPEELGSLSNLTDLRLYTNRFTALPDPLGQLVALLYLDVSDNPHLSGAFPDTTACVKLHTIWANGCSFTTAGPVGPRVEVLSFPQNSFTALPPAWTTLSSVATLNLRDNAIAYWRPHGVWPLGTGLWSCWRSPLDSRLEWPNMERVDLSGNPLGRTITARSFIWSLGYLRRLSELTAARCGLRGGLPASDGKFGVDMEANEDCNKVPLDRGSFPALFALDLSENNITAILVPPPKQVSVAELHSNAFAGQALHTGWFSISGNLEVWDNPQLRADVAPPHRVNACPSAGSRDPEANPYGWQTDRAEDSFECTTLCAGLATRYKHDHSLNVSSLCRCKAGWGGSAMDCTRCPANTYSHPEDTWQMVRTCRPCPMFSTTAPGTQNATGIEQCFCSAGWYMGRAPQVGSTNIAADANMTSQADAVVPACVRCKQWPVQTSSTGATRQDQCFCNPLYDGLRSVLGSCGCADGAHMDHRARRCRPCDLSAEHCSWGPQVELSLLPPVVRAAYWAQPRPEVEPVDSNFSRNDIWRCVSEDTCREGGLCAAGRHERACSLCKAGLYGGPDGECQPCPQGPAETRRSLLLAFLVGPVGPLIVHWLLQGEDAKVASLLFNGVPSSVKQLLKYVQMLGVLSSFSLRWPPAARQFLKDISRITVALPQLAGPACLTGQQTASLEMAFRWLMPAAWVVCALLAALVVLPARRCSGWESKRRRLRMGHWEVLRVSLWGLVLFYSTLLQYGTVLLTCARSPNGRLSVMTFPHLECGGPGEWAELAAASCVFLFVFVLLVYSAIYAAWRRTLHVLIESTFISRGWWGFLFDDYRHGCMHWLMLTMLKDVVLVAIATAGAGEGVSQLLATAAASTCYSYLVLRDQPFRRQANSFLEAWTAMSLAVLCVVSAGFGYQSLPDGTAFLDLYVVSMSESSNDIAAQVMVALMWLTLVGPVMVILYQVLTTSDRVGRRLPRWLRPEAQADRQAWDAEFFEAFALTEEAAPLFRSILQRFDAVDYANFRQLMGGSVGTVGVVKSTSSGIHGATRRRLSHLAKRSPSFVSQMSSNLVASCASADVPAPGPGVDAPASPADDGCGLDIAIFDDGGAKFCSEADAQDSTWIAAAMTNSPLRPDSVHVTDMPVVLL